MIGADRLRYRRLLSIYQMAFLLVCSFGRWLLCFFLLLLMIPLFCYMYMCMALFRESRVFIGFFFPLTSHFSVHFLIYLTF